MITIDYQDKRPIYEQITEKLKNLIVVDVLTENDKIPSVRNLAIELSINPNTIQRAYQELERDGYIYTVKGRGNFVSPSAQWKEDRLTEGLERFEELAIELCQLGASADSLHKRIDEALSKEGETGRTEVSLPKQSGDSGEETL
ncbi:MAG: GntR family transcriptional regulator [Lachnospiraceae bacterium]|nr:GntR family transcriptional regulator [Lachnospiraceae bacterium]